MSKNKCSLIVVKDGRRLHGTAAILHMTSTEGGFDKWLNEHSENVGKLAAEIAIREFINKQQKPKLRSVK